MAEYKLSKDIKCLPNELFEILVSPEKTSPIKQHIVKLEKENKGPVGKGTVYRQVIRRGGQESESLVIVTEVDKPSLYQLSMAEKELEVTYTYALMARGKQTQITLTAQIEGEGFRKPLAWIVAQKMKQRDGEILKKLKDLVEEQNADSQN